MGNQPGSEYYARTLVVENTAALNVRSGPGSHYAVLARLAEGDRMTFLAMEDGWVKVRLVDGSLVGYVYYRYVAIL